MKRKQGLKRTGPPKRKTAMKRGGRLKQRSPKKEREIKETTPARRLYLAVHPDCMACGRPATEVHEIPRGGCRQQSVRDADCWLTACRDCHDHELGDYARWPPEKQIALKLLTTLASINQIRAGLPQSRLPDVIRAMQALYES